MNKNEILEAFKKQSEAEKVISDFTEWCDKALAHEVKNYRNIIAVSGFEPKGNNLHFYFHYKNDHDPSNISWNPFVLSLDEIADLSQEDFRNRVNTYLDEEHAKDKKEYEEKRKKEELAKLEELKKKYEGVKA